VRAVYEVRRALSPMERWYWVCDQLSPLNVIARVHLTGRCSPVDLERASALLVREHPLLRVAVAARSNGRRPRFVEAAAARLPIRFVETEQSDADRWVREVDEVELTTSLDWRAGPLARIVDVVTARGSAGERHDLILTMSHTIADGTTALELLRRLVELAAGSTLRPIPRAPLPPPEAMLPARVNRMPRVLHFVAATLADGVASALARPRRIVPDRPLAPDDRRTRLIRRELTGDALAELIAGAQHAGVSVHSALVAAMAIAVADPAPARTRVTIGSPVDFRAELVPPVESTDAGAYVATVPAHVAVDPGAGLWSVARGAHRDLRRRTRFHQHLALVTLLRFMSPRSVDTSAKAVAMVDRMGPGNVCLSNLGRHDFPDRVGEWELSGAQFVAGVSVSGYLVAAVNTSHGVLHWNFTYVDGALTAERAELIVERAVAALLSGLRHPKSAVSTGTKG
jgi:NRPS condensation-like uncharacterized protein